MVYLKDAKRGGFYSLAKPEKTTGRYVLPLGPVEQWYSPRSRYFISIFQDTWRLQYLGYMTRLEPVVDTTEAKKFLFDMIFLKTGFASSEDAKKILKAL